jgi:sec-independent protein translocase protein TatA
MARPGSAASLIVTEPIGRFNCKTSAPAAVPYTLRRRGSLSGFAAKLRRRADTAVIPSGVAEGAHMTSHAFSMLALIGPLGLPELLIVLAIVVLIFGANRLPQLGKGLGQSIRNFKGGLRDGEKEEKDA